MQKKDLEELENLEGRETQLERDMDLYAAKSKDYKWDGQFKTSERFDNLSKNREKTLNRLYALRRLVPLLKREDIDELKNLENQEERLKDDKHWYAGKAEYYKLMGDKGAAESFNKLSDRRKMHLKRLDELRQLVDNWTWFNNKLNNIVFIIAVILLVVAVYYFS